MKFVLTILLLTIFPSLQSLEKKIYPSEQLIVVNTDKNAIYNHVECEDVKGFYKTKDTPSKMGSGKYEIFKASKLCRFHYVEEFLIYNVKNPQHTTNDNITFPYLIFSPFISPYILSHLPTFEKNSKYTSEDMYSIEISLKYPNENFYDTPCITLTNDLGEVITKSNEGYLHASNLLQGKYSAHFEKHSRWDSPPPLEISLCGKQKSLSFVGEYSETMGNVILECSLNFTNENSSKILEDINIVVENSQHNTAEILEKYYDKSSAIFDISLPPDIYQITFRSEYREIIVPEPITINVKKNEIIRINKEISPKYTNLIVAVNSVDKSEKSIQDTEIYISNDYNSYQLLFDSSKNNFSAQKIIPGNYVVTIRSPENYRQKQHHNLYLSSEKDNFFNTTIEKQQCYITLNTNIESASWLIMKDGKNIIESAGNVKNKSFILGNDIFEKNVFEILPEEISGYKVSVLPSCKFILQNAQSITVDIKYTPVYGYVVIAPENFLHTPAEISVELSSTERTEKLTLSTNEKNKILSGNYIATFTLPEYCKKISPQKILITENEIVTLRPKIVSKRKIFVKTNTEHATFILQSANFGSSFMGKGATFTFEEIPPGDYSLIFGIDGKDDKYFVPEVITFSLLPNENYSLAANYEKVSKLLISSNMLKYSVKISSTKGSTLYDIYNKERLLTLPEGFYQIEFLPISIDSNSKYSGVQPTPSEVFLHASKPERVYGHYNIAQGSLVITTNLEEAKYSIQNIFMPEQPSLGTFYGKFTIIPITFVGNYKITFYDVVNHKTPQEILVEVVDNERQSIGAIYSPIQKTIKIPQGPSILGDFFGEGNKDEFPMKVIDLDTFYIGETEVTNAQFAAWLTTEIKKGSITYSTEKTSKGQIYDMEGNVLFETVEADSDSKISSKQTIDGMVFSPLEGKESYPVVEVSWFGANAYCKSFKGRLPTEAEWEKAAGVKVTAFSNIKKFRYGFSSDNIEHTMANYYLEEFNRNVSEMLPTKFFNGFNVAKITSQQVLKIKRDPFLINEVSTKNGISPWGVYDMSGNVREWVNDWYNPEYYSFAKTKNPQGPSHGVEKVVKGGSFNDFPFNLRVSSRNSMNPSMMDEFTGFRIVFDNIGDDNRK